MENSAWLLLSSTKLSPAAHEAGLRASGVEVQQE